MKAAGRTLLIIGILVNSLIYSVSGQWVQTNGPCGGTFKTITTHDSILYTSVFERGVFRSTDQGKSWTAMNEGLNGRDIFTLVSFGNELIAGTELNGVYICSESNGHWSQFVSKSGNYYARIFGMTVRANEIWAATDYGLIKLYKENGVWVDSLIHTMRWSQAVAITDSFIYISTGNEMERSSDHGIIWTVCTSGLSDSKIVCIKMLDNKLGFVGTEDGAFITSNGGTSWSIINNGIGADDNSYTRSFTSRNDTILFSSFDKIWISIDRGTTWTNFNPAFIFNTPEQIGLMGNSIFLATAKGIFKSSFSDRKWIDISNGIISGNVAAMLKVGGTVFAGCNANGKLFRSDDNGLNWAASVLYAGCEKQSLMQSTDFGRSWTKSEFSMGFVRSFAQIDSTLLLGHFVTGIYSLTPHATVLLEANKGFQQVIPECGCSSPYPTINSLAALDNTFFAALENYGIFSSTTKDTTWYQVNSGLQDSIVRTLLATNGILLAGTQSKGIFRSTNLGASWNSSTTNLSGIPVLTFAENGSSTYAGTVNGVYYSIDSGVTWNKGGADFTDTVTSLLIDGGYLLAGTTNRGVWRRPISEFSLAGSNRQVENFAKSSFVSMQKQGYFISCSFNLTRADRVVIGLYNLQGKLVGLLKDSRVSPGDHVFESDLRKYKSGCYVIRFESGSMLQSLPFTIY
jgi:photosystem II stability/assembly factor-like uncharacterized protein